MSITTTTFDYSHGSTNPYTVEPRHALIPRCLHCHEDSTITFDGSEYFAYFMRGAYIQDAFRMLDADQREHILSGTHPACWDAMMGPEPE